MPLQKALVPIDLSGSLDTKTDEKLVLSSKLVELENAVFTKGKSVEKRFGYSALGTELVDGSTLPTGEALTSLEDELLVFGSNKLYSYASGLTKWVDRGGFRSVDATSSDLIRNENQQSAVDCALSENIIVYAWEDTSGGVRCSVVDSDNGVVVLEDALVDLNGRSPRVVSQGKNITIFYADTDTGLEKLAARQINVEQPTSLGAIVTVASDINTTSFLFDVVKYDSTDDSAVVAYANTSNTVTVSYIDSSAAKGNLASGFPNEATLSAQAEDSLSISADKSIGTDIYVAFGKSTSGTGLKVFHLNGDLTTSGSTTSADATKINRISMILSDASTLEVYYEHDDSNTYDHLINKRTFTTTSNSITSATVVMRSVGLVSRPFQFSSTTYLWVIHESVLQPTYFLIDSSGLVLAKYKQGLAGAHLTRGVTTSILNTASGIFECPAQVQTRLTSTGNDVYSLKGISRLSVDFEGSRTFLTKQLGKSLLTGGGFTSLYDTQEIAELGFHIFPENVSCATATSSGSLAAGTYSYKVIYVFTDANGRIHRSAPSSGVQQTTTGSTSKNTLTIPTLRITDHSAVDVEVYRTINNGTLYFKVGSVSNDESADTVSFVDSSITDANLIGLESLYTNGGVLDNIAPPAQSVLGTFKNRMFVVSSEDPQVLYYSKQRLGDSAIEFNDSFKITVNEAKSITGIQQMDEKLILFEDNRIFLITGNGPTPTGDNNDFSDAQLITSDAGCVDPRSIVLIPQGILFKSNKGIYLLNRSLETVYIGAPVERFNSNTITSADLLQDVNQVRFLCSNGDTICYDYYYNKYSIFTSHQGNGATVWQKTGNYVYLRTDGSVWEQSSAYTDDGAFYPLKLTTSWLKTDAVQGLQRVRKAFVLGEYQSDHILKVQVGYDFEPFFRETHTFNYSRDLFLTKFAEENPFASQTFASGSSGDLANGVYQFRMHLGKQKCECLRFTIEDTEDSATAKPEVGQSYSVSNMMLEVGLRDTGMKLPQQKLV